MLAIALGALTSSCLGGDHIGSPSTDCRAATIRAGGPKGRNARVQRVGQIPTRLPTSRRVVALTFDAGGNAGGAAKIFAALRQTGAEATFFMTGRWAEGYPGWARRIAARYPIADHTCDHRDLTGLSRFQIEREIVTGARSIRRVTGRPPSPLFRFPYGAGSPAPLGIANRLGYTAVGWTVDSLGWEGTSRGRTRNTVIERALGHLEPGEIILMHTGANPDDHSTLDADALPTIIGTMRRRGYTFVTLSAYL